MKASYPLRMSGVMVGYSDFGGACILVRTSWGRVSATLVEQVVSNENGRTEEQHSGSNILFFGSLLVEIGLTTSRFDTFLLGLGECFDVTIHRVLESIVRHGY